MQHLHMLNEEGSPCSCDCHAPRTCFQDCPSLHTMYLGSYRDSRYMGTSKVPTARVSVLSICSCRGCCKVHTLAGAILINAPFLLSVGPSLRIFAAAGLPFFSLAARHTRHPPVFVFSFFQRYFFCGDPWGAFPVVGFLDDYALYERLLQSSFCWLVVSILRNTASLGSRCQTLSGG